MTKGGYVPKVGQSGTEEETGIADECNVRGSVTNAGNILQVHTCLTNTTRVCAFITARIRTGVLRQITSQTCKAAML
jgi:hypothetical protein